jgi:hypothetical protein
MDHIRKVATEEHNVCYFYLGLTYELGAMSILRMKEYLEAIESAGDDAPIPFLIIGHVDDSNAYLEAEVLSLIKLFQSRGHHLEIPALADRIDDVCMIAQATFTTLRIVHPFLSARTLSREAVNYLQTNCSDLSYSGLVRLIRNAMALTGSDVITIEELKSFGGENPTAQHLIESLADEKFFQAKDESAECRAVDTEVDPPGSVSKSNAKF